MRVVVTPVSMDYRLVSPHNVYILLRGVLSHVIRKSVVSYVRGRLRGIQLGRGLGFRRRNARVVQSGARNTSDRRRFRSDGDQSSGYGYWFGGGRDRFRSRDAESTVRELPRRFRSLGRRSRRGSDGPSRTVVRDDCGDVAWGTYTSPCTRSSDRRHSITGFGTPEQRSS